MTKKLERYIIEQAGMLLESLPDSAGDFTSELNIDDDRFDEFDKEWREICDRIVVSLRPVTP